jgi:2-C-methyl-D-erythritol 4-phosphate cytidylyltransferase
VQVLLLFEQHPAVGHAIVAVPSGRVEEVTNRLRGEDLGTLTAVVRGGEHRQASVHHALRAVPDPVNTVLVHDAARPFVSSAQVQAIVQAVQEHGAAAPAVPVADALRRGGSETFGDTIPRDDLYRMQTPQGARRAWLEEAHRRAVADDATATDDVALVQRIGHEVHRVPGSRRNFKITTPEDWALAQHLWPAWSDAPDRLHGSA